MLQHKSKLLCHRLARNRRCRQRSLHERSAPDLSPQQYLAVSRAAVRGPSMRGRPPTCPHSSILQ